MFCSVWFYHLALYRKCVFAPGLSDLLFAKGSSLLQKSQKGAEFYEKGPKKGQLFFPNLSAVTKSYEPIIISNLLNGVTCKRRSSVNSEAWLRRLDDVTGVVKTDIFRWAMRSKQWQKHFYCKRWCYTMVKKVYFEVLLFLVIWVSQRFGDKKMSFNSCECIKFLNIANFHHVFHVWENAY